MREYRILLRRDYPANWISKNPILADGEPGYERTTGKFKIGDGSSRWTDLNYFTTGGGGGGSDNGTTQVALAGTTISGDRAVAFEDGLLVHASSAVPDLAFSYAGISLNAASIGDVVTYKKIGTVSANFWSWTVGSVFLGTDGQLTQTPTLSGILLNIGWALDAQTIDLHPSLPIRRG